MQLQASHLLVVETTKLVTAIVREVRAIRALWLISNYEFICASRHYTLGVAIDLETIIQGTKIKRIIFVIAIHVLVCCQIHRRYYCVIERQYKQCKHQDYRVKQEHNELRCIRNCVLLKEDNYHCVDCFNEKQSATVDEDNKVAVIVQTNTIPQPCAMMIKTQNTVVTK